MGLEVVYVVSSVGVGAPNTFQSGGALTVGTEGGVDEDEDEEEEDEEDFLALRMPKRPLLAADDCAAFFTVVD
jgi:hypothetical protein